MHNASTEVKSKRIHVSVHNAFMSFDDRPDPARRLEQARKASGFASAREAATRFGWVYETYVQHENGIRGITRAAKQYARAFRVSEAWLLTGEGLGPSAEWSKFSSLFDELTPDEQEDLTRHARALLALRKVSAG